MTFSLSSILIWLVLLLLQVAAAIPWVLYLFGGPARQPGSTPTPKNNQLQTASLSVLSLLVLAHFGLFFTQRDWLETMGGYWGALLQTQLTIDAFLLFFFLLLKIWPKGGAVALAAFQEGIRQPMFWLLTILAFAALTISPYVPYFTFGEDYLMVKELGYDTLMLAAVLFGTLAASMFIAEEIEGRTAVTVMSKPISRRQFLLGKFVGIVMAGLLMFGLLACYFGGVLDYKFWWDRSDPVPPAVWIVNSLDVLGFRGESSLLLLGIGRWINHTLELLPGLVLSFCQVSVLVSVAVTLATRLPMVVNMSAILILYLAANLTPVLVGIGQRMQITSPGPVSQIVAFTSQMFDTILPGLAFFRYAPTVIGDTSVLSLGYFLYVGSVILYAALYTGIVLLLGLILFEDRDLA
jgi:ABC-type transport system involved in multi-copper enzyme maturation permease subunit